MVQLLAEAGNSAPTATGQTKADGTFTLVTPPFGTGAVPGSYRVVLQQYGGSPAIPWRFGNPGGTPLHVVVPAEGLKGWDLKVPE
jgi:hypothetical protein